jgi:hypothetical protein
MKAGMAAPVAMLRAPLRPIVNISFKRLWTYGMEHAAEFEDLLDQMNGLLGLCGKLSRVNDLPHLYFPVQRTSATGQCFPLLGAMLASKCITQEPVNEEKSGVPEGSANQELGFRRLKVKSCLTQDSWRRQGNDKRIFPSTGC